MLLFLMTVLISVSAVSAGNMDDNADTIVSSADAETIAVANDVDANLVFAQQVLGYADAPHDVLIALSTSGNSVNVVKAAATAKALGIRTLAITGGKDSKLSALADVCIRLPAYTPYEVQELTLPVYHALCAALEAHFFAE